MNVQTETSTSEELVTTIDVRELHAIRWGIMRQMFPKFVEEVELGRHLRDPITVVGRTRPKPEGPAPARAAVPRLPRYRIASDQGRRGREST